jgi:hypothetical protein
MDAAWFGHYSLQLARTVNPRPNGEKIARGKRKSWAWTSCGKWGKLWIAP